MQMRQTYPMGAKEGPGVCQLPPGNSAQEPRNHQKRLLNHGCLGPTPRDSDAVDVGRARDMGMFLTLR